MISRIIGLVLLAVSWLSSVILYPSLPDILPTHWNFWGEPDSWAPKSIAAWMLPTIATVAWLLFQIIPRFDPKKEKYALFQREWQIIQNGLLAFFTYLHLIIFHITMQPQQEFMPLMFLGLGALFVIIGNYLSKIRQNYFLGIRTPWTLSDEENWNKTHRFASWSFVLAGLATMAEAYFLWHAPIIIFGGIMLAAFLPMLYSFLLFQHRQHWMKYVLFGLVILLSLAWYCGYSQVPKTLGFVLMDNG
jgi:uncharacterized membrane protein